MRILNNPLGPACCVEFSPDSHLLLAAGRGLCVWDMLSGEPHLVLREGVLAARMADNGRAVVLTDRNANSLNIYSILNGVVLRSTTFDGVSYDRLSISQAAERVAVVDLRNRGVTLWDWTRLIPLPAPARRLDDIQFSPDGRHLAVIDRRARISLLTLHGATAWDAVFSRGRCGGTTPQSDGRLVWSPNSRWLVAACDQHLNIFDAMTGALLVHLTLDRKYYQDMAFTADSRFLATVSYEQTVKVYETATWSLRHELAWSIGKLACIAFSPDGMLGAVGNVGKKVLVWDIDW